MTLQDAVHVLRTRWITVVVVTVAATIIAGAYAWLATPIYAASTRIFIATPEATDAQQAYAAGQFAQGRIVSYTDLIRSEALATRTVSRLNLNITPRDLAKKVGASANTDSVVITLSVTDPSPTNAVSLANALSDDFVGMVQDLETPAANGPPAVTRAVTVQAAVDSQKVSPYRKKIISFGVNAGLLLGAMVALLRGRPKSEIEAAQHDSLAQAPSLDLLQDGAGSQWSPGAMQSGTPESVPRPKITGAH
jgi:capsular polysaccharide biosynthesis protein